MRSFLLLVALFGFPLFVHAEEAKKAEPVKDELKLEDYEQAIVDKVNAERTSRGLTALEVHPKLMEQARRYCHTMTASRGLNHSGWCAENIACGQKDAPAVMNAWMNSKGHRSNILCSSYKYIGVAGEMQSGGRIYWCQQFWSRDPDAAEAEAPVCERCNRRHR